jgi:L-seryl-tRNA(Ser) seleniumtransferase
MVDTAISRSTRAPAIYERMGIRTVINAAGAATITGGSLMSPETAAAMVEAAKAFVMVEELNARVGEKIAEVTGAEAGVVTCGSYAAMTIAAAACITGTDPAKIKQLPDTTGLANEIVIHRSHRLHYDQAYRVAGAKLVEIGVPYGTERWELEHAITDQTVAIAWHDSPNTGPGALDFATVIEVAHVRNVPVIVDAASTLPPVDHLKRWVRWGADLVIYSGGKGIRGPQDSGMLAGRADLIAAARLNGPPHASVGRGMKVSKEAMAGLWVALEQFMTHDHEADYRVHRAQCDTIAGYLSSRSDCRLLTNTEPEEWPAPIIRVFPNDQAWNPRDIDAALLAGDPAIKIVVEHGGLMINTHGLQAGEDAILVERLREVLPSM